MRGKGYRRASATIRVRGPDAHARLSMAMLCSAWLGKARRGKAVHGAA